MKKNHLMACILSMAVFTHEVYANACVRGSRFGLTLQNGIQSLSSTANVTGNANPNGGGYASPLNESVGAPLPFPCIQYLDYASWNDTKKYSAKGHYAGSLSTSYIYVNTQAYAFGLSVGIGLDGSRASTWVQNRCVFDMQNDTDSLWFAFDSVTGNGVAAPLKGALSYKAKVLVGKQFSWGLPYIQVGFKARHFQLNAPYAQTIIQSPGTNYTFNATTGLGWNSNDDSPTYSIKKIKKWAPGLSVAMGCDFDISPCLSMGFSAEYDFYGSLSMNISHLPISGPIATEGTTPLSTGNPCMAVFNPSTFSFMVNMTYNINL